MANKIYRMAGRAVSLFLLIVLFSATAQARIITVDDDGLADFNNIQAAIDDAGHGDVIIVNPGTYTGEGNRDIDFLGKAITVRSIDPKDPNIVASTIIDCNGTEEEPHRGFYFHTNEDANSVLDGLTITNGYTSSGSHLEEKGGAILCENSNPTIANCAIISNTAYWSGGGICFYKCYGRIPSIISCTFFDNWAGFNGGGMASYDSSPILNNCTFGGNFAGGIGGGIAHTDFGSPTLTKCRLIGNAATSLGGGMCGCDGPITNCTITGNWAGDQGGGLAVCYGPITNCTITDNSAQNHGGGLAYCGESFTNCIIWGNSNEQIYKPLHLSITYNDIQGGWPGLGNINADPCFVDEANGDCRLLPGSPCIDAGDPNYVPEPNDTDFDGNPRVINGRIDMGAYEYNPPVSAEVEIDPNTLNLNSQGRWITAFIRLPEEYYFADIDPNSILLESQIKPERFWFTEDNQIAIAKFDCEQVRSLLNIGEIEITITGQLTDGTAFEASDVIKVIDKGGKK